MCKKREKAGLLVDKNGERSDNVRDMEETGVPHFWLHAAALHAAGLVFLCLLLAAARADWLRGVVPDGITWGGMLGSLVMSGLLPELHHAGYWEDFYRRNVELFWLLPDWSGGGEWKWGIAASLIGLAAGLGLGSGLRHGGRLFSGRDVLGGGDVKLLGFIGAFLGWKGACLALLGGSLLGIGVGVVWRLRRGVIEMPFAPFLGAAAACFCVWRWF